MKRHLLQISLAFITGCAFAQGTFQFDQQVNPTTAPGGFFNIAPDPTGESFVPSLSAIDFVQFYFDDSANGLGSSIAVNIWSGSIGTGTLLGTSEAVSVPDGFNGASTFLFAAPVSLNPGTTYYLQPFIQSGDSSQLGVVGNNYANGSAYLHGVQQSVDFWFREGALVPEPSSFSLAIVGLVGIHSFLRTR